MSKVEKRLVNGLGDMMWAIYGVEVDTQKASNALMLAIAMKGVKFLARELEFADQATFAARLEKDFEDLVGLAKDLDCHIREDPRDKDLLDYCANALKYGVALMEQWLYRVVTELSKKGPKMRRRPSLEPNLKPLTARQMEVCQIVAECKGDFAEAGRRLRIDRKTVKQHYDAALRKMRATGVHTPERKLKTATRRLPESRRGEVDAFKDEDGQNRPGRAWRSGKRQDED